MEQKKKSLKKKEDTKFVMTLRISNRLKLLMNDTLRRIKKEDPLKNHLLPGDLDDIHNRSAWIRGWLMSGICNHRAARGYDK